MRKKTAQAMPVGRSAAKPTRLTITAPRVAPICGIRSVTATTTASANGYGRSTISAKTKVVAPASTAMLSAPTMYAPTLARISSPISCTRSRRDRGTNE